MTAQIRENIIRVFTSSNTSSHQMPDKDDRSLIIRIESRNILDVDDDDDHHDHHDHQHHHCNLNQNWHNDKR